MPRIKAKILKISLQPSKLGSSFYYVFFKSDDGMSYKTCLYPHFHNFKHWQKALKESENKEVWLDNLFLKSNGLIDADSQFTMQIGEEKEEKKGPEYLSLFEGGCDNAKAQTTIPHQQLPEPLARIATPARSNAAASGEQSVAGGIDWDKNRQRLRECMGVLK